MLLQHQFPTVAALAFDIDPSSRAPSMVAAVNHQPRPAVWLGRLVRVLAALGNDALNVVAVAPTDGTPQHRVGGDAVQGRPDREVLRQR